MASLEVFLKVVKRFRYTSTYQRHVQVLVSKNKIHEMKESYQVDKNGVVKKKKKIHQNAWID